MTGASLVIGFGCERGIAADAVERGIARVLNQYDYSTDDIDTIATIELKNDERGLIDAAGNLGVDLKFYDADRLGTVTPPNPNPVVKEAVGVEGVAETAAMVAAGKTTLLYEKTILHPDQKGMTLAIAELTTTREGTEPT